MWHRDSNISATAFSFILAVGLAIPLRPVIGNDASPRSGPGKLLATMLQGPLADVDEIVFAVRVSGRDHWYVNFGYYSCDYGEGPGLSFGPYPDGETLRGYGDGGRLCRLNLRTGQLTALIDDPQGGVRDPQVHYSGTKILLSYRKGGTATHHLYEINVDGTGLRQLTDGPDDDIEPTYLPSGEIMFCSSRCRRFVNCWFTRVATLYRCDGDGHDIRMPITIGGTFTMARVLGTVPVEPDGSAYMQLPALRSLFLVALDQDDLSVKRMQSFVTLQPGERTSCVGCHEQRSYTASLTSSLLALQHAPRQITPIEGVPDVLDFPRDIQPILDKHCVACHNPDRREGQIDLAGDRTPKYSTSYWTITRERLVADGRNQPYSNRAPRTIGSSASRLMGFLDGSHHGARLSDLEPGFRPNKH
jgi:hypothetical protein